MRLYLSLKKGNSWFNIVELFPSSVGPTVKSSSFAPNGKKSLKGIPVPARKIPYIKKNEVQPGIAIVQGARWVWPTAR